MRARWAVPAALAVVFACAPARAELRARTRDLCASSPIVSLVAWDKGGSESWGAGIPTPTVDCAATGTSSSASLQCSGATPSFAGPGETAAGSPWWYRNDTAVRPSILLNGSTDYYTLGDVGDTASDMAACVEFRPDALTGVTYLFGKTNNSTGPFGIYQSSGSLRVWIVKAGGGYTEVAFGTVSVGTWYAACFGYDYVADGSSVLRTTLNGVAGTPSTTAVGPLEDTAHNLAIGAATNGTLKFAGAIRRVALWTGADAPTSAAQLAQMVATQNGLAHDRPAGAVASCSRSDSTYCGPFSDAEQYLLGPGFCCIHAPSYSGWASGGAVAGGAEVYGIGQNALGYSETFANAAWTKSVGVTAADASASCPMSPLAGTRMSLVTTDSDADQIAQDAATTPGRSVWMARATGDSACGITFADASGDGAQSVALTDGPVRYYSGGAGQTGLSVARPVGGCARWCMWLAQAQASIYPVPPRSTPGATAYAGLASTATTVTVPVALTDPARWAIGITSALGTWSAQRQFLMSLGSGANAASIDVYSDAKMYGYIYDSTGTGRTITGGAHGWLPGSQHTAMMAVSGRPDATIYFDGAPTASTASGAGTGVMSAMPATLAVGSTGTSLHIGGLVYRVAQCRRAGGCR